MSGRKKLSGGRKQETNYYSRCESGLNERVKTETDRPPKSSKVLGWKERGNGAVLRSIMFFVLYGLIPVNKWARFERRNLLSLLSKLLEQFASENFEDLFHLWRQSCPFPAGVRGHFSCFAPHSQMKKMTRRKRKHFLRKRTSRRKSCLGRKCTKGIAP